MHESTVAWDRSAPEPQDRATHRNLADLRLEVRATVCHAGDGGDVFPRCDRHALVIEAFIAERERVVLGVPRRRTRDAAFDHRFSDAEARAIENGVPPMFTLRPALRALAAGSDQPDVRDMLVAADMANAALRQLLDHREWVSPTAVGWTGAFAAALLVAHADDAPDLRGEAIVRMRTGLATGIVEPRRFAHIADRDAAMRGDEQIYGTLFVPVDGVPRAVWPMPDEPRVDLARQNIGLPPLQHDRTRYERGARPGPFLVPSNSRGAVRLAARVAGAYLRHRRSAEHAVRTLER